MIPRWIHPNAISVFSLFPGVAAALLAADARWNAALAVFALNRILDGLDGLVARERSLQSDLGGYIDLLVDFAVYAVIPIGVWWGVGEPHGSASPVALVTLLAAFYVNAASWMYLAALIEKRSAAADRTTSIVMPRGLIEGTETVIFYALFLIVPHYSTYLFFLMAAATVAGSLQRVVWAMRRL